MSSIISVEPIYGWGWTDGLQTVGVPRKFVATVDQVGSQLIGKIGSGEFEAQTIVMTKRHQGQFDGMVNVAIQGGECGKLLSGFAKISRDLME